MGLISRVSSRTYRSKKNFHNMADKTPKLRVAELRESSKDMLTGKLIDLRPERLQTRKDQRCPKRHRQGLDRHQPDPKSRTPKALPRKIRQTSCLETTKDPSLEEAIEQTRNEFEEFEDRSTRAE